MNSVAIVCSAGIVSGKEIVALELADGLRSGGFGVHLLTSRWGSGEFARRATQSGFNLTHLWLGFISASYRFENVRMTLDQLVHWPALAWGYGRFISVTQPGAVIHTNWHHALLLRPFLKRDRDIYWLHEILPRSPQYRWVFGRLRKKMKHFVAVSQAAANSLGALGVPDSQISVIYNGLSDPIPRAGFQEHHPHSFVIGIVGQIAPWKGHEHLLEAFSLVTKVHPSAELRIFGKGTASYEELLRAKVRDLGLEGRVTWKGFVRDRSEIYRDLSVMVVPSLYGDPLPTTAIEAAFFGLPVVASRVGGLPEIIEHGRTGYLYEVGMVDELTRYLNDLLKNGSAAEEMGANARKRAVSVFSRERFVRQFTEQLDSQ